MIGQTLGPYEVVAKLGEGGMGAVYRGRDARLDRDVAIKILPPAFAADATRLLRFEREARTLAALNHPNIAQLYGVEDVGTMRALIMELVPGRTLDAIILDRADALPLRELLTIARQIAEALEAAHGAGIVHRDLKPANIKVRDDGVVKVLDFGLAKPADPAGDSAHGAPRMQDSPTMTGPATALGMILGTAAYMAPEQARGKVVDRRADVWAFGVILYEMLTRRRAFDGPDVSDVLASILKDTLPLDQLPADTPTAIRRLLRRCLEKDRADRLDSMTAARLEVTDALASREDERSVVQTHAPRRRSSFAFALAAAASTGAVIAAAVLWPRTPAAIAPPTFLTVPPLGGRTLAINVNQPDLAISPDGRRIVYGHALEPSSTMYMRSLDGGPDVALPGLGDLPRSPFFSPDGKWLAYYAGASAGYDARLMKVATAGGVPVPITAFDNNMRGASWGDDGRIVFASIGPATGLLRVPADGGTYETLTRPNTGAGELDHLWPEVLPGSTHVLFTIVRRAADGTAAAVNTFDLALLDLQAATWRVLRPNASYPKYLSSGHVAFVSHTGLFVAPFDLTSKTMIGDPVSMIPDVIFKPTSGAAAVAISATGTLAYIGGAAQISGLLSWVKTGGQIEPIRAPERRYEAVRVSPDDTRAAVVVTDRGAPSIAIYDFQRETLTPLTPATFVASEPIWSEDGRELFFAGSAPGADSQAGIYRIAASGTSAPVLVLANDDQARWRPASVIAKTRAILAIQVPLTGGGEQTLVRVPLDGPAIPETVMPIPGSFASATVSPDGRWLAYSAPGDKARQIYVRPWPNVSSDRIQVSADGGRLPVWSADNRRLYFQSEEGDELYAADVDPKGSIGRPVMVANPENTTFFADYSVSRHGQRFLRIRRPSVMENQNELRLVLNWFEVVKAKTTGTAGR